ncbi:uroporphyrinogen-III synthase [Phenylobacterium deserti]|uniref:Uroporphyrinogen-III synthase n=1 Tax=Phenylobacterium deserti TaxID=1914756 RepID=A0A328ARA3_9CAUL|nr:uroporphyrinogen-III synthase [Phenylobacterium deserti]RAK57167.1 uroporphyrinogen-III synthase [Phenylobacterium deserti]
MAGRRKQVWITRAQPGADLTAERVRALGHTAMVEPLLLVRNLADVDVDLSGVGALAFTSANGVRAFTDVSGDRSLRVFAVGSATGQAARQAGFRTVLSSDGDVSALAGSIAARKSELGGAVLHPGAVDLAGDLVGALEAQGVAARRLTVYETVSAEIAEARLAELLRCDTVLLHSPRAAEVLAKLLKAQPTPTLRALGLSKNVLKPLTRVKLAGRLSPPHPLEAALLSLISPAS